ncbi:hypothetical protein ATR1_009d0005 [Acetobacter tropicalis]|nr:hypothetical protein ATR1_009d0005 [Acetobacter tropicalis]
MKGLGCDPGPSGKTGSSRQKIIANFDDDGGEATSVPMERDRMVRVLPQIIGLVAADERAALFFHGLRYGFAVQMGGSIQDACRPWTRNTSIDRGKGMNTY